MSEMYCIVYGQAIEVGVIEVNTTETGELDSGVGGPVRNTALYGRWGEDLRGVFRCNRKRHSQTQVLRIRISYPQSRYVRDEGTRIVPRRRGLTRTRIL